MLQVRNQSFFDFFKSYYYSNTYLDPVDLSEQEVSKHLLETESPEAAATAQRLISDPEVQEVLSEPLTYDFAEIAKKNDPIERHGFKILGKKQTLTGKTIPFYSVIEHEDLKGWIIKSGAKRVPEDQLIMGPLNHSTNEMAHYTAQDSLLRVAMANRIANVAHAAKIDVIIPKKKFVAYANSDKETDPCKKYCLICEKLDILSVEDTVRTIEDMDAEDQRETARKISTLVQKAGIVDASFENIRFTPDKKLALIDTEPAGLMVVKKPGIWNQLFGPRGASVEKCARVGLFTLMTFSQQTSLTEFFNQIKIDHDKCVTPKLSNWKIGLSICSLGLIPLINAIASFVQSQLLQWTFGSLMELDTNFQGEVNQLASDPSSHNKIPDRMKEHQKNRTPKARQYFAHIEDVPLMA